MDCSTENKGYKKVPKTQCLRDFLVRWKGLEPPTYWFVASHSIQLSYQRIPIKIYQLIQLLTKCPQVNLVFRSQSLYPAELPARNTLLNCKYALYTKTTVWFVASHSIQLSYQRIPIKIYQLIQLLTKYPQVDLVFRSQSLYPAELPAHLCVALFVLR